MSDIKTGKVNPELVAKLDKDGFRREYDNVIRRVKPTDNPNVKELWSGTRNGMNYIGKLELETEAHSYYSTARFADHSTFPPLALTQWGEFLTEYVNAITEEKDNG